MSTTQKGFLWIGTLLLAGVVPLAQAAATAIPGTINYIEGQVTLEGQALTSRSVGSVELQPNQVLSTDHGKAEILLTPGVFLRVGDNSAVRLISPELTNTQVEVLNGEAMVEADQVLKGNNISIMDHGATTRLEKHGLYAFKSEPPEVAVYDGKASVMVDDQKAELKKGKETLLTGKLHPQSFDRKASDDLLAWSGLRSEYASEASVAEARNIIVNGGGWGGPGWYWDPWWSMYSYIPGDYLYSPFGWGFFGPSFVYYAPYYGGYGYYRGYRGFGHYGGHPVVGPHGPGVHSAPAPARGFNPGVNRGFSRGFGGGMRAGGGFHGGGGGGHR